MEAAEPIDTPDPVSTLYLPPITLASDAPQLLELEWHPTRPLLATTDVEGAVCFYAIAGLIPKPRRGAPASKHAPQHQLLAKLEYHKESCRSIVFHPSGLWAYTCSADKSIGIIDLRTLTLAAHIENAHDAGINRLAFFDEHMLISGDDDGFVHVWDLRAQNMSTNAAATAAANAGASAAATASAAAGGRPAKSAQQPKPKSAAKPATASASSASSSAAAPYGAALYPLLRYEDSGDYISDILPIVDKNRLVITSGDGHLYVYDMRPGHMHEKLAQAYGTKALPKPKPLGKSKKNQNKKLTPSGFMRNGFAVDTWFAMSDDVDDELAGALLLKRGRKLVAAGREEGVLNIFRWDFFGKAQDHFSLGATDNEMEGSGASIDCMVKIDEDTIVTGSTDGLIRLVQLHPNKLVAILGTHEDFPVESMKMSPERAAYFDLSKAKGMEEEEESDDEEEEAEEAVKDEDNSDEEDAPASSAKSTVAPLKPSGPVVLPSDSHTSAQSILGSSLLPRFLASSSHDGVVKFWNCSELFEVDPDEQKPEEEEESDDEADAEEAKEGTSDAEDADSDDDEKQAEQEAESSIKQKQSKKAAASKRKRAAESDEDDEEKDDAADAEEDEPADDAAEEMSDASGLSDEADSSDVDGEGAKAEAEDAESDAKPASKKPKQAAAAKAAANPFAGFDLSAFAKVAPAAAASSAAAAAAPAASKSANPFARIAPAAAAPTAAASASPAAPVTNAWLLVAPASAPTTRSPRDAKGGAGVSDSDDSDSDRKPREKKVLNADPSASRDAGFFANLPTNHPMHPANQHKRLAKAPLVVEVDNIAKRPAKKLAALQEKLRTQREAKARREARRAEAVAKGEDPDMISDSEDEVDAAKKGKGKGKGKSKVSKRAVGSDDDSDADSDDSDGGGAKPVKERKLTSKEKKAMKKAERKKNPFFSGL